MRTRRLVIKALLILAAGTLGMQATAQRAVALSGCIQACCFCEDPNFVTCSGSTSDLDGYCQNQGCGPAVECSNSDSRCDDGQLTVLIECHNPNG